MLLLDRLQIQELEIAGILLLCCLGINQALVEPLDYLHRQHIPQVSQCPVDCQRPSSSASKGVRVAFVETECEAWGFGVFVIDVAERLGENQPCETCADDDYMLWFGVVGDSIRAWSSIGRCHCIYLCYTSS